MSRTKNVIGIEQFTSKKNGELYTKLHMQFEKNGCEGVAVDTLFCKSADVPRDLCVGSDIIPYYSSTGFLEEIEICE